MSEYILGIDPGVSKTSATCGVAVMDADNMTLAKKMMVNTSIREYFEFAEDLCAVINEYKIDRIIIEDYVYFSGKGYYTKPTELMAMNHLIGFLQGYLGREITSIPRIVTPQSWKIAVRKFLLTEGSPLDKKDNASLHVQEYLHRVCGEFRMEKMEKVKPAHWVDAFGLAMYGKIKEIY